MYGLISTVFTLHEAGSTKHYEQTENMDHIPDMHASCSALLSELEWIT